MAVAFSGFYRKLVRFFTGRNLVGNERIKSLMPGSGSWMMLPVHRTVAESNGCGCCRTSEFVGEVSIVFEAFLDYESSKLNLENWESLKALKALKSFRIKQVRNLPKGFLMENFSSSIRGDKSSSDNDIPEEQSRAQHERFNSFRVRSSSHTAYVRWYLNDILLSRLCAFMFFVLPSFNTKSISWPTHTVRRRRFHMQVVHYIFAFGLIFCSLILLICTHGLDIIRWSSPIRIIPFSHFSFLSPLEHRPDQLTDRHSYPNSLSKCYRKVELILIKSQKFFPRFCCCVGLPLIGISWNCFIDSMGVTVRPG